MIQSLICIVESMDVGSLQRIRTGPGHCMLDRLGAKWEILKKGMVVSFGSKASHGRLTDAASLRVVAKYAGKRYFVWLMTRLSSMIIYPHCSATRPGQFERGQEDGL